MLFNDENAAEHLELKFLFFVYLINQKHCIIKYPLIPLIIFQNKSFFSLYKVNIKS